MSVLKGILIAMGVLVVIALIPFNIWKEIEVTESRQASFLIAEARTALSIESGNGNITIMGVEGLSEVQVSAQIVTWGNSNQEAEENLSLVDLTMEERDGIITLIHKPHETEAVLRLRGSNGYGLEIGRDDRVHFNVEVPVETTIEIRNHDGDMRIENVSGTISISTDDGDANIINSSGQVTYHSDDGDIILESFTGSVTLNTEDGDITFSGTLLEGEHTMHTEDGNVDVTLSPDAALEIDLSIDEGDLHSDIPFSVTSDTKHYTAVLNEPVGRLVIRVDDDGDVTIREAE